ncbi:MAG TPA: phosphate ABC transporter substrate-binding/OmpA family protein [Paracoccaceae bacterium]|nr:phosphate ABC transporter substrate-binding/OmpA family protein [Paracoccaceae bacterium]
MKTIIKASLFALAASALGAVTPVAAAENTVTLKSFDGSFDMTGDLVRFDGETYVIDTDLGQLSVRSEFVLCEGDACTAGAPEPELESNQITLRAFGGGAEFTGEMLDFDGESYVLLTNVGELTIRSEFVECIGDSCPSFETVTETFSVAVPAGAGEFIIGEVVYQFASEKSLNVTQSFLGQVKGTEYYVGNDLGELVSEIVVTSSDATSALEALAAGDVTYAITRHQVSDAELSRIFNVQDSELGNVVSATTIALDTILPIINPANDRFSVSMEQVAEILSGGINNWSQLGGDDAPINVYGLGADAELTGLINSEILDPASAKLRSDVNVLDSSDDLNIAVLDDEYGFAVTYRSEIIDPKVPSIRNTCDIVSTATPFSLQTEEYPLVMRWYVYSRKGVAIPPIATNILEYIQADEGQQAFKAAGLAGLDVATRPLYEQGDRLMSTILAKPYLGGVLPVVRDYFTEVVEGERLSPTFRFLSGSTSLDERSQRDIKRISDMVTDGVLRNKEIVLVGFSDSVGSFGANIGLSQARANQVKSLILDENIGFLNADDIQTLGFGPIAPVGCNETVDGRAMNRRVEVWVR